MTTAAGVDGSQVLARIAAGQDLHRIDEIWYSGGTAISDRQIAKLFRDELLERKADKAVLTELGRLHVERTVALDHPNRWLVERGHVGRSRVIQNLGESPLGWLMQRNMISARQFAAGERLRLDFLMAGTAPSVTMRWERSTGGRAAGAAAVLDATEAQIVAKRRFEAACTAVGGGLHDVLTRVICLGEGLATAERALGWPARAGKVVLGIALDRLAAHYD